MACHWVVVALSKYAADHTVGNRETQPVVAADVVEVVVLDYVALLPLFRLSAFLLTPWILLLCFQQTVIICAAKGQDLFR